MKTYTYSTDAVKNVAVEAEDADSALAKARNAGDWAKLGSQREAIDIRNGAWLTLFDADGVPVMRRGEMP